MPVLPPYPVDTMVAAGDPAVLMDVAKDLGLALVVGGDMDMPRLLICL